MTPVACAMLVCTCCFGCRNILASLSAQTPAQKGTWVGRVERVDVFDAFDGKSNRYDVLSLRITKGPELESRFTLLPKELGAGQAPLLVRVEDGEAYVIKPGKIMQGDLIEVRGEMRIFQVRISHHGPIVIDPMVSRLLRGKTKNVPADEHLLVVSGKPKVLQHAAPLAASKPAVVGPSTAPSATAPAGEAAAAPAAGAGDPLAAARAYAAAWGAGDVEALRRLIHVEGADEQRSVDRFLRQTAASAGLERAARRAYGAGQADKVLDAVGFPDHRRGREAEADFDRQRRDGDDADIEFRRGGEAAVVGVEPVGGIPVERAGGRWLIDWGGWTPDAQPAARGGAAEDARVARILDGVVHVETEVADAIADGKYDTAAAAASAVRAKVARLAEEQ